MNLFNEDNLVEKTVIKLIKEIWGDLGKLKYDFTYYTLSAKLII